MLLRIRYADEEDSRRVVEAADAELRRLHNYVRCASERQRAGRADMARSVISGSTIDRIAGQEEIRTAERLKDLLSERIDRAQQQIALLRREFLRKRMERMQIETLLGSVREQELLQACRKEQSSLDEWHRQATRGRRNRGESAEQREPGRDERSDEEA